MRLNAPRSVRIRGGNIIPTPTEVATGAAAWANLILDWDWSGWVKEQIDRLSGDGNGGNCVRMIGDFYGIRTGMFNRALYLSRIEQLVSYCASRGMYVYLCGGDQGQVSTWTNTQIADEVIALINSVASYGNIIGCDVMQEQNAWSGAGEPAPAARTIAIYDLVKAAIPAQIPLTFSQTDSLSGSTAHTWIASIASALDFIDHHAYDFAPYDIVNPVPAVDLNYYESTYPDKGTFFGEFGISANNTEDDRGHFYAAMFRVLNDPRVDGGCMWSIGDQSASSTSQYGMYDSTWSKRRAQSIPLRAATGGYVVPRY